MEKPRIIMADTDSNYIMSLQVKFIEEYFDKIDLEVITNAAYFAQLFSTAQQADILIVSEKLYSEVLLRHNISCIFMLTEQPNEENTGRLNIQCIYKYTSVKEIFGEIIGGSKNILQIGTDNTQEPKIILVYSPCGGTGKTTLSMGICSSLIQNHRRTLYINASYLQNFQYMLQDYSPIGGSKIYSELLKPDTNPYRLLSNYIRKEGFSYLPAFNAPLMAWGIDYDVFARIALAAKQSGDYDYILIDADSSFDSKKAYLLEIADKVFIITQQSRYAVCATNDLAANIDGINMDKYIFICNQFQRQQHNALVAPDLDLSFCISEYVDYISNISQLSIEEYVKQSKIPNITLLAL